ncbi:hypothetical protein [Limosilactobacillus reuteri]|nr:hypothetical protein [Limosilactobacillus reuteri]
MTEAKPAIASKEYKITKIMKLTNTGRPKSAYVDRALYLKAFCQ